MVKTALLQATGKDSPYVLVLPPPVVANRAPRSSDIMPVGQLFVDNSVTPNDIYTSLGNGTFASGGNNLATVTAGTGITATTGDIVATAGDISTGAGSITSATTLTATLGAITATNGNLVLGTAGNKIASTSVGTIDVVIFPPSTHWEASAIL